MGLSKSLLKSVVVPDLRSSPTSPVARPRHPRRPPLFLRPRRNQQRTNRKKVNIIVLELERVNLEVNVVPDLPSSPTLLIARPRHPPKPATIDNLVSHNCIALRCNSINHELDDTYDACLEHLYDE